MDTASMVFYRIDVRTFFDSDADGMGDINGVNIKLDYIKELGADAVMLSPVFTLPSYGIDTELGSEADLVALIDKAAAKGIGVILEFGELSHADSSDAEKLLAAMRTWLERGILGVGIGTDNIAAASVRSLHRAACRLYADVLSDYPSRIAVGLGKNMDIDTAVQLSRSENRAFTAQLFISEHMRRSFAPKSRISAMLSPAAAKHLKHDVDYWQVQSLLRGGHLMNGIDMAQEQFPQGRELLRRMRAKAASLYSLTLGGTPVIYQGQEIGLYDTSVPMQWSNSRFGGFTLGTPRVKLNSIPSHINMEDDITHMDSVCLFYRKAIALRHEHAALTRGDYSPIDSENPRVAAYLREDGAESLLCVVNLTAQRAKVALPKCNRADCLLFTNSPKPIAQSMVLQPYEGFVYKIR